jgi:hypothetical protein
MKTSARFRGGLLRATLLSLTLLAGCETAAPFQPRDRNGTGYTDERLAENRFRVTFTGNSVTRRETVENYLLLRAAQVTLQSGRHWFVFDTRDTQAKTSYHTDFMGEPGWPGWPGFRGGFGWYWHDWDYEQADTYSTTRYDAYAEIVTLTPEQAKNEPRALNADDVVAHLTPTVPPPH